MRDQHWTKRLAAVLVACGLAGCAAGAKGLVRDERTTTKRLQFSGAATRTLDARTISGSIRVTGDTGSDVRLEAVTAVEAEDADALSAAFRDVAIETEEQGATVAIIVRDGGETACGDQSNGSRRGPAWWDRRRYSVSTTLNIRVPRDVRVRLCTVNGVDVSVTGTQGDFDVSNVNGKIVLRDVRGSGRATTVNGGIDGTFADAPREESRFKTVNGDIAVTFPPDLSADLHLKTFNGGLFTDFETTMLAPTPEPARRAGAPRYVYSPRGFSHVRVGAGGPELTFDTLNGDVRILRASR
jgi:hypothetical protein